MSHTITSKLNKTANQHQGQAGTTFFVELGEKNFNFKTKQAEYTNYTAALFAKDTQIAFYQSVLVEGAVIEVTGTGLIMEAQDDPKYKAKLMIQDAKLGYTFSPNQSAPQQQQNNPQQQQQPPAQQQQPQMAPQQQQQNTPSYGNPPPGYNNQG